MNFFESELLKIVRLGVPFSNPKFVGGACYGQLDENLRIKLQFVTRGYADHYTAIKATVINRVDGQIDSVELSFKSLLGTKQVTNPNFRNGIIPYAWTCDGKTDWYVYQPNQQDYKKLNEAVNDYCGVFQSQEMGDPGMRMGQQL